MTINPNFEASNKQSDRVHDTGAANSEAANLSAAVWHPKNAGDFRSMVIKTADEGPISDRRQIPLPLPMTPAERNDWMREQHDLPPLMIPKLTV